MTRPARRQWTMVVAALTVAALTVAGFAGPAAARDDSGYVVQQGDTLWELARKFATSVQNLASVNALRDPDRIVAGQRLEVPGSSAHQDSSGATTGGSVSYHVVQRGETLSSIASRYGVSVADLATANGILDSNLVWVGSRLRIAAQAPALPAPTGAAVHQVQRGETLTAIAARYGVSVSDLAAANGIDDPDHIIAGTTLRVPGGWLCPVAQVTRLVNDFGAPRHGGRFHEGIDLFAPAGTEVRAPVGGTVEQIRGTIGGLQFTLRGDDGNTYIGAHMERFGQAGKVAAGTVLGYVGNTGDAVGGPTHLHFELHPAGGSAVNPYPVLLKACPVG